MVPGAGLEPARLAAQAPKTCVATNYTIPARYRLARVAKETKRLKETRPIV